MSKTKTTATHESICAVCFGAYKLDNGTDRTARHGFTAHNIRHGMVGAGWHTGACFGVSYPHYGASCEGTKVAFARSQDWRASLLRQAAALATKPALTWTRKSYNGVTQVAYTVNVDDAARNLAHDPKNGFYTETLPSYESLWERAHGALAREIDAVDKQIAFLADKIMTWKPAPAVEIVQRKHAK